MAFQPNTIDLWIGSHELSDHHLKQYAGFLSPEERVKADSFKRMPIRRQYLSTRIKVRKVLATYLGIAMQDVEIVHNAYGKPALKSPGLFFNVSHSGGQLAMAVTDIAEIGIDIEQVCDRKLLDSVAERCFAKEELAYWRRQPLARRLIAFFKLWTAKEAFVKATGRGIALGLQDCVIDCREFKGFIDLPSEYQPVSGWKLNAWEDKSFCCSLVLNCPKIPLEIERKSWQIMF